MLTGSSCTSSCPGTGNQNGLTFGYVYDRYGNRWQRNVTTGSGPQPQYSYNANNRITTSGYTFDAAGNIINDGSHTYTYDAENRIVKVDSGSTGVYTYDAEGRRVAKTSGSGSYEYLFDLGGRAVTELLAGTTI
jgi:YD repeat-containing protein